MTNRYRSIQFAPDGAYIFEYSRATVDQVWHAVNNQGSRWVFYPIPFVVTDNPGQDFKYSRIISAPDGLKFMTNWTIRTAREFIINNRDEIIKFLL